MPQMSLKDHCLENSVTLTTNSLIPVS